MEPNIELIQIPIKTDKSFLNIYTLSDNILTNKCISEISDKLGLSYGRNTGFFSDKYKKDYYYAIFKVAKRHPLTPSLSILLDYINNLFQTDYNGILINKYDTGKNFIVKHSDSKNHPAIGVMIISVGATRTFRVRDKYTDQIVANIPLIEGQMIHMGGNFQTEFTHEVPCEESVTGVRYSINFHRYEGLGLY